MPILSIIVPVYNAEKALRRCVDSILAQELTDFELIVMDDGSKDSSGAILDEYAEKDPRVRVVHKPNSGVSDTRNRAISMASGKYLQFVDADDWLVPEASLKLVRAAEEQNADMVIADFYRVVGERTSRKGSIDTEGLITRNEFAEYMERSPADYYYGVLWNKLFRRDILEKYNLRMDENLSWCEDFIFNMEYILHIENVYVLRFPIYYYVKTEGSLIAQSMRVGNIVRMKLNVIEYYSRFYKNIYSPTDYALKAPVIYGFLVDIPKDDAVLPGLPGTRKLGEERTYVRELPGEENTWTAFYYEKRLMDRVLDDVAVQTGYERKELEILIYLMNFGSVGSMREISEWVGSSVLFVTALIEKLAFKGALSLEMGNPLTARISPEADKVCGMLKTSLEDAGNAALSGMSEEDKKTFWKLQGEISSGIRKYLQKGQVNQKNKEGGE